MKSQIRFALLFVGCTAMFAAGPVVHRNHDLNARINQGIRSGSLTQREAASLRQEQVRLQQRIHHERLDGGGLTARERIGIDRAQDRLSDHVYREKHDWQRR